MHRAKSEYAIQTVTNALRLLEVFEADEEIGVTDLARRLHLHKNNVFRLLATLEDAGWVEQSADSERYRLGSACLRLARSYVRTHGLARRGRCALEELTRATGETAHLGVLRDFAVVHVDGEQSPGLLVTGLRVGSLMPSHSTALGKVLLGCGPAGTLEAFDRRLAEDRVAALTAETIVDRDKLIEHLRCVAAQGWALDLEESAPGVMCAAAPVFDATGRTVAALSVSGPAVRLDRDVLEGRIAPAVVTVAANLSQQLGAAVA
ncbi:IclR family transcriptional regulator [Myxococcota bacterium]|nr:IclR family transcriptional regulator [Myxococcota bacterium]MCZ7617521.1 IclR family transcriptional regulator [Myxococcota bacterium]